MGPDSPWAAPPDELTPTAEQVHVWRASLDLSASRLQALQDTLSPAERRRAASCRSQEGRSPFVGAPQASSPFQMTVASPVRPKQTDRSAPTF